MKDMFKTEDWWALWIGLLLFALSLGLAAGADLLGWAISTKEWLDVTKAMAPASKTYEQLFPLASLGLTYLFLTAVLGIGATALGFNVRRFILGFTVIFFVSYASWLAGHYAYIAATPNNQKKFGIAWSLGLTGEAGYLIALLAGLIIGNFIPGLANWLKEATRPEWFIKTAIVLLGGWFALKAVQTQGQREL